MAFKRGFLQKGLQLGALRMDEDTPMTSADTAVSTSTVKSGSSVPAAASRPKPRYKRDTAKVIFHTGSSPKFFTLNYPKGSPLKWYRSGGTQGLPLMVKAANGVSPNLGTEDSESESESEDSDSGDGSECETEPNAKDCHLACVRFGGAERSFLFISWGYHYEHVRRHPRFNDLLRVTEPTLRVRVGESLIKGKSLYAKKNIPEGAVIMFEYPLLVQMAPIPALLLHNFNRFMREMEPEALTRLEALHNCKPTGPKMNDTLSKCRTNAFSLGGLFGKGEGDVYAAIYDVMSRANHSCNPNAEHDFDE